MQTLRRASAIRRTWRTLCCFSFPMSRVSSAEPNFGSRTRTEPRMTVVTQPAYYSLRVREVIDDTADAKSIVFEIPTEHAAAFRYKPGQFLTLRVAYDGRQLLRCYSLASCP